MPQTKLLAGGAPGYRTGSEGPEVDLHVPHDLEVEAQASSQYQRVGEPNPVVPLPFQGP